MKNQLSTGEEFELWVLLNQVRHAIHDAVERELRQYGISPIEAAVLSIAKVTGKNATPAEISRWLLREPHSVSGLVSRMEKKGLVRKVKDLPKKNLVRVAITDKGEQAYSRSLKIDSLRRITSSLSREQRRQTISCLKVLRSVALKEIGKEKGPPFP